ncbi:hypothetical protein [Phenylobacterium sp.]|uniref:hypothetical protein n=1 Tax=Phenylobacterium sp. TaxID=1871053 RepID=UPI00121E999A|nr:hypothetical protein [Phenylobacterium sp.]THD65960.1 MAG: hypothetical protein E8A12_06515 [Phenylobacterium sp.]
MDIHRPKAAHSVREFLIEIGTIICGILIALGLEQTIELLHWRHVVGEEREALKDELGQLRAAMLGRMELEPCFAARLAEVNELIRRHDAGAPLGQLGRVGRALNPNTNKPLWELGVADQSLAHMTLKEKRRFIEAYNWVDVYRVNTTHESEAWRSLQVLNHAAVLSPADWSQVRKDYEEASSVHWIIASSFPTWMAPIKALATEAPSRNLRQYEPVKAFCTPMLATK